MKRKRKKNIGESAKNKLSNRLNCNEIVMCDRVIGMKQEQNKKNGISVSERRSKTRRTEVKINRVERTVARREDAEQTKKGSGIVNQLSVDDT